MIVPRESNVIMEANRAGKKYQFLKKSGLGKELQNRLRGDHSNPREVRKKRANRATKDDRKIAR